MDEGRGLSFLFCSFFLLGRAVGVIDERHESSILSHPNFKVKLFDWSNIIDHQTRCSRKDEEFDTAIEPTFFSPKWVKNDVWARSSRHNFFFT